MRKLLLSLTLAAASVSALNAANPTIYGVYGYMNGYSKTSGVYKFQAETPTESTALYTYTGINPYECGSVILEDRIVYIEPFNSYTKPILKVTRFTDIDDKETYTRDGWVEGLPNTSANTALCVDPVSKKIYGFFFNEDKSSYFLGTLDPETGLSTKIKDIDLGSRPITIAISNYGVVYGITQRGKLFKGNYDGDFEEVGELNVKTSATSSRCAAATFDPVDDTFYWVLYDNNYDYSFCVIDPETCNVTKVVQGLGSASALYIPVVMSESAPVAISDLSVTADGFDTNLTVSFTVPNQTVGGSNISAGLSAYVAIDGNVVEDGGVVGPGTTFSKQYKVADGSHTIVAWVSTRGNDPLASQKAAKVFFAGQDKPAQVGELTATKNADKVILTWTAPTEGAGGGNFDTSTLSYRVSLLPSDKAGYEEEGEVLTENTTNCQYTYSLANNDLRFIQFEVVARTSAVEGIPSVTDVIVVGEDFPGKVENLTAAKTDDDIVLSWDAPSAGANGSDYDAASLKYNVYLAGEETPVASDLTSTSYTYKVEGDDMRALVFVVKAKTNKGEGEGVSSEKFVVGSAYAVPYSENFDNASSLDDIFYTVIDDNDDGRKWTLNGTTNKTARLQFSARGTDQDDWLITAPIKLDQGLTYLLSYDVILERTNYGPESLEIWVGKSATVDGMTQEIKEATEYGEMSNSDLIEFSVEDSGVYYIGFHCVSPGDIYYINLDNISLEADDPTIDRGTVVFTKTFDTQASFNDCDVVQGDLNTSNRKWTYYSWGPYVYYSLYMSDEGEADSYLFVPGVEFNAEKTYTITADAANETAKEAFKAPIEFGYATAADIASYTAVNEIVLQSDEYSKVSSDKFTVNDGSTYVVLRTHFQKPEGETTGSMGPRVKSLFVTEFKGEPQEEEGDFGDESIEGEWNFALDGHYLGDYSLGEFTETMTATLDGNYVRFESSGSPYDIIGKFTAENTLTFNKVLVGSSESAFGLWQEPYVNTTDIDDIEDLSEQVFTATYNAEEGTITFPAGSGLRYGYFNNATGALSYWDDAFDLVSAKKVSEEGGDDEPGTVIYSNSFETESDFNSCTVVKGEGNTSNNQWKFYKYGPNIQYSIYMSDSGEADSYLFIPNVDFAAGKKYTIGVDAMNDANNDDYKATLEFGYATDNTIESYTAVNSITIPSSSYQPVASDKFTVTGAPTYAVLRVHFQKPEGVTVGYMGLKVKNMVVTEYDGEAGGYEKPEIPEDAYVVYNEGQLGESLEANPWWNATWNFNAANPEGEGVVYEFKTGGESKSGGSMGLMTSNKNVVGPLHDADLNFNYYATAPGKYIIRLTGDGNNDFPIELTADDVNKWTSASFNVAEQFPALANVWDTADYVGNVFPFAIIIEADANVEENAAIYFDAIYYTNLDTEWEAPVEEIPEPETVPEPVVTGDDMFSFFSSEGTVGYGIGGWGQSTQVEVKTIDNQPVLFLGAFNYLGLDNFDINVSDYDYMHVDYWTSEENTPFGFVPISLEPTKDTPIWNAPEVKANEWNSYDAPLSGFDADLSSIEQIKFVANQNGGTTKYAYIANVYFWKEAQEEGVIKGTGNMTTQLDMSMGMGDEPKLLEPETFEIPVVYNIEENTLKFEYFAECEMPIEFVVNLEDGKAIAANQVAYIDDNYGEGNAIYYYYGDIASETANVYATVENYGENQTKMTVNTWGEFLVEHNFFNTSYYNTEIILDFVIPGLNESTVVPTLELQDVTAEQVNTDFGFYFEITGKVVAENLAEDATIEVCYTNPSDNEPKSVEVAADGTFSFTVGNLMMETQYTLELQAKSGNIVSETCTLTLAYDSESGVAGIEADAEGVRYFDINGFEVKNPQAGQILIKVKDNKATKVVIK